MPHSAADNPARQPPLWLLVVISALAPITMNGVLPANTAIMHELSTSYGMAQVVLSVYLFASMISQILLGNLADRIGRRPVMIGSLVLFGIGGSVCAIAASIEVLLAGRFIQGFGSSVCVFLTRTIMRDVHPRDKAASAIGYMVTAMMAAPLFGPALFSWRIMYILLATSGFLLAYLSHRHQHETLRTEHRPKQSGWQSNKDLLREREYLAYVLIMCGSVGIYFCYLAGAPYVVMELRNHSATTYGAWFSTVAIGYLAGNFIAGKFSESLGTQKMLIISMIPMVIGILLFWVFIRIDHLIGLFLPMLFIGLSNGICLPNLTSAAMSVRSDIAGSASGLLGTLHIGTGIAITLVLSATLQDSELPLYVAITFSGVVALSGLFVLLRKV